MIIILDDTFENRHKYNDIAYLNSDKFKNVCTIHSIVKTTDLESILDQMTNCDLFCTHKTLQLLNDENQKLVYDDNTKNREQFLKAVKNSKTPIIQFSRGSNDDFTTKIIDKNRFYTNLQLFLDYYIETSKIELKILYYGKYYEQIEFNTVVSNLMKEIRKVNSEDYSENEIIEKGLKHLFPNNFDEIINEWKNFSKKEIIQLIQNKL